MNNILELCKIFHCQINDLVNDSIIDLDSMDEETKKNIVKLKHDEQKKMKALSKIISVIAKICSITCKIAIPIIIVIMIATHFFLSRIDVKNNEPIWNGNNKFSLKSDDSKVYLKYNENILIADANLDEVNTKYIDLLNNNSKYIIISYIEIGLLTLCITLFLMIKIFNSLEKLFKNINQGDTPFTLENINYIKKMAWLMIIATILPNIGGAIFSGLIGGCIANDFEMFDLVQILFLFSMIYIFKYGYQLQLDSKAIMYGDDNE